MTRGVAEDAQSSHSSQPAAREESARSTSTSSDAVDATDVGNVGTRSGSEGSLSEGSDGSGSAGVADGGALSQVRVRAFDETCVTLHVDLGCATAGDLLALIEEEAPAYSAEEHRLVFQGRILEDETPLLSAGVRAQHTLLLFPRPPKPQERASEGGSAAEEGDTPPTAATMRVLRALQQLQAAQAAAAHARARDLEAGYEGPDGRPYYNDMPAPIEGGRGHWVMGFLFGLLFGWWALLCFMNPMNPRALNAGAAAGLICFLAIHVLLQIAILFAHRTDVQ